jgi:hypothetical protein
LLLNERRPAVPLNEKGQKILKSMREEYGEEKGERVFYASKQAGRITGVDSEDAALPLSARSTVDEEAPVPERETELAGRMPTEGGGYQPAATPSEAVIRKAETGPPEEARTSDSLPVGDQSLKNWNARNKKFWGEI